MEEQLILVDEKDNPIGQEGKLAAHLQGLLHRCISIFIFNSKAELLLQKRAKGKYHSGGLWTNSVCGHPRPGEDTEASAHRRLQFEMGFDCPLKEIFTFTYQADLDHGIREHEFDHVYAGTYDGEVKANPEEADDFKWISPSALREDVKKNPDSYTFWFKLCFEKALAGMLY